MAVNTDPSTVYRHLIGELLRERTRLLTAIDSMPALVWAVDADLRLTVANQSAQARTAARLGRPLAVGEDVLPAELPSAIREDWLDRYRRALEGERVSMRVTNPVGDTTEWWDHSLSPIRGAQGEIIGASVIAQDVSDRVRAEQKAELREREFHEAQRIAGVGSWDLDVRSGVIHWSENLRSLFGLAPDVPAPPLDQQAPFYRPDSWRELNAAIAAAIEFATPYTIELALAGAAADRWIEARGEPIVGPDGRVIGLHGVTVDVTARRRAEQERLRLEGLLIQSQKMEAIGQLAGGIAHDFNNILSAILLQVGVLHGVPALTPGVAAGLHEIEAAAQRAASLTRQLLVFSRRQPLTLRPVELTGLVSSLLGMLRRLIGEHIHLALDDVGAPVMLHADPGMLEQVVMNLVVNARDAMPRGGRLEVALRPVEMTADRPGPDPRRSGPFVEVTVRDTGTGIDPALVPHLFEPFFTTKDPGKGTGLGLATAYGIVSQHGGWIDVESTLGVGTTFRVLLPRDDDLTRSERPSPSPLPPVRRARILLVEDEPALRMLLRQSLELQGHTVVVAADGREALRFWQARREPFDLVVSDLIMPGGVTGRQLLADVIADAPHTRTLLVTGYAPDIAVGADEAPGGQPLLHKPFTVEQFSRTVAAVLGS